MPESFFKSQENIKNRLIEKRTGSLVSENAPPVSVVIPCYKNSALIAETLQTVCAQTFRDFEILLVNDGSPDTEDLEKSLADFFEKIIYIRQENTGAAGARNTGIYFARGKYIAFLDGDDLWLPEYLEKQIDFMAKTGFQMAYCNAWLIGHKSWEGKTYMDGAPSAGEVSVKSLIAAECNVITSGTVVEKAQILARRGFDETAQAHRVEDFDLWIGLLKQGCRIGYQKEILLKYRVTNSGLSGGNVSRAERTVQALNLIKEKNSLTAEELNVWKTQIKISEAYLELEKGKFYLTEDNYKQSLIHLAKANQYFHRKKILLVMWLIKINPRLAKKIYKNLRADEVNFDYAAAD